MDRGLNSSNGRDRESAKNRLLPPIGVFAAILGVAAAVFVAIQVIDSDENKLRRNSSVQVRLSDPSQMERGKGLAEDLCGSCHLVPKPDILPKTEWRVVLSYMGFFLGQELGLGEDDRHYREYQKSDLLSPDAQRDEIDFILNDLESRQAFLAELGLVPATPTVSDDIWEAIRAFYEGAAPDSPLPPPQQA